MAIQGSTNRPTIHEKFSNTINTIQGLCQKLNGKTVTGLQKNICKGIIGLCEKYNNSLHSLQGHDRRVVARAYLSYKKNQTGGSLNDSKVNIFGQRVNKGTINNTDFDQKALNLNFVKTLQGKDLKAFTALLKNDESIRNSFVKQNRDELLNSDNKTIFNSLPMEAQKAALATLSGDKQIQFCKTNGLDHREYLDLSNHEVAQAYVKEYKDALLQSDNKTIFNSLPMEAQKAFIEQNKGDIEFLSTFSNVYKDELKYDSFSGQPMPELLTAFKDAIVSNRDQIIKNPTILASADKASVLEVASTLLTNSTVKEEDKPLMKALLTAYATVDANIVETQLKLVDKDAMFTPNSNAQPILDRLLSANTDEPNEVSLADKNTLGGIQVIKDLARDSELELKLPSGKTIDISKNFSKRLEGKGDSEKALAIFNEMKKQVSGFDEKDKSAFIDFMCNFATQGFASVYMPNMPSNKIDISGGNYKFFVDYSKQDVNGNSFVEVGVHVNGRAKGQQAILDNSLNLLGVALPTTNAEIVFTYDKGSLLECNNKASNIEVKHFEQEIGDITFV